MKNLKRCGLTLVMLGYVASLSSVSSPHEDADPPRFAAPKRLMAGEKLLGTGRAYASPVLHDLNGDGHKDVVIGDLFGRITVAYGDASGKYGAEEKVMDRNGDQLEFSNW